jgi:hypothetical protein
VFKGLDPGDIPAEIFRFGQRKAAYGKMVPDPVGPELDRASDFRDGKQSIVFSTRATIRKRSRRTAFSLHPERDYRIGGDPLFRVPRAENAFRALEVVDDRKIATWGMWWAEGWVCPRSQFRIVVVSQPMIIAASFCSSPKSNRRLRIASPTVATSFG